MKTFENGYEAYWFLANHRVTGFAGTSFMDVLDVTIMKVDPTTHRVEDDALGIPSLSRNTEIEVWLESGPGYSDPEGIEDVASVPIHDPELDCGGPTFEAALITLAEKVAAKYGD